MSNILYEFIPFQKYLIYPINLNSLMKNVYASRLEYLCKISSATDPMKNFIILWVLNLTSF